MSHTVSVLPDLPLDPALERWHVLHRRLNKCGLGSILVKFDSGKFPGGGAGTIGGCRPLSPFSVVRKCRFSQRFREACQLSTDGSTLRGLPLLLLETEKRKVLHRSSATHIISLARLDPYCMQLKKILFCRNRTKRLFCIC